MEKHKKLLILFISLFIALSFPINALASDNEFSASLTVSPKKVAKGSSVTSTITIINKDKTYGADISVSYKGEHIKSFYLAAGAQSSFQHILTINEDTSIYYTIYASHGPDISSSKNSNTVSVTILKLDTHTPSPTKVITNTHTHTPLPTSTNTATPTLSPIAKTNEVITPSPSLIVESGKTDAVDGKIGWSAFVSLSSPPLNVFDGLYKSNILYWLGIKKDNDSLYSQDTSQQLNDVRVYKIRKLLFTSLLMILIISVIISIILIVRYANKLRLKR